MMRRLPTLLLALVISGTALGDDTDPPARAARLSLMQGQVILQAAGAGAPEEAELNRPLTLGDRLMTDTGSRAEMSVGTAAVRLDESTDLTIVNLDDDIAQIELNSGTLGIHLREFREGETFEIDTPNATVLLLKPGDYRVEVDSQGATVLAVRNGEAELDGGAGPTLLTDQQELRFVGPDQHASVQALGPLSDFDEWCIERERVVTERHATRYVSRDVVGYEDLDSHGRWYNEPGYGYVWSPSYISIGWAPYSYGRWVWISPWGFTWIDYSPWGYAPFHYGRWAFVHQRWCWVPPRHHRPVFAPALVGWTGMPGVRDPRHAGSVGWYPLGPREVYVPGHRVSARYLRNVNVSNTTIDNNAQITNAYRGRIRNARPVNSAIPGALTTVPAATFGANRSSGGRVLRANPNEPEHVTPPVKIPQPVRDTRWREAFNNARNREGSTPPVTTLQPGENQRTVGDERRTTPRIPTDRRLIQGNIDEARRTAPEAPAVRYVAPPRNIVRTEPPRNNVRTEPPRTVVRIEPPRTVGQPEHRRAAPVESWQNQRVQRAPSQPSRSMQSDSSRNNGGGSVSSSRSNGGGSASAGASGNRGGSAGHSNSSSSRAQSGRTGFSTNRQ